MYDDPSLHDELTELAAAIARPAGATRWGRSSCSSPCPVCRTPTRAPSCGTTPSSTRTTAGRSTSTYAERCWHGSTAAGVRRSTPTERRSCSSCRGPCGCGGRTGAVHLLPVGARARAGGPARGGV
ncbi:hypothetical protein NKG94_12630 [Micromonospora sp. M12]